MTGVVVFVTGLPSAGKSTFAKRLCERTTAVLLDGDEVRSALVPPPGYDDAGRRAFYRTLGGLAGLLARQGHVVVVAATANLREHRAHARAESPRFIEVFVDVDADECAMRDAKGLYAAVRRGAARDLPGADAPYEAPSGPHVVAKGGLDDHAIDTVLHVITNATQR